jgi:hypothetical protein
MNATVTGAIVGLGLHAEHGGRTRLRDDESPDLARATALPVRRTFVERTRHEDSFEESPERVDQGI